MTTPQEVLADLQNRANDVQRRVSFSDVANTTAQIDDQLSSLSTRHKEVRQRGYVFAAEIDSGAEQLTNEWESRHRQIDDQLQQAQGRLKDEFEQLARLVQQAAMAPSMPALQKVERAIVDVEGKVASAESDLTALYTPTQQGLSPLTGQLGRIEQCLGHKDEAGFDFDNNENIFQTAQAEWVETGSGKEDPDGILFLTDQRLIFEQKEKVGKKLGMFGGKEVQEVEWAIPLSQIAAVSAEDKGLLGGKDLIHLTLGEGADYGKLTVEIKGGVDSKVWADFVQRATNGDINNERIS